MTRSSELEIVLVPVLTDNYVFLAHEPLSGETAVIDPAVAEPVLAAATARGWAITQILNTHWHPDHVGGNLAIVAATGASVTGPAREATRIPGLTRAVDEGDRVAIGGVEGDVLFVGAHTAGHIAYHFASGRAAFVGDTLFALGCGRLFEGTPAMMHAALGKLAALPGDTAVYCAHEYTTANLAFALMIEPENEALRTRAAAIGEARAAGHPTVPTSIALELATNPFVRARDVAQLGERRAAKDAFRG